MKVFDYKKLKEYSIFIWLIIITIIAILSSAIFRQNTADQNIKLKETLDNIYLKKTLVEITNNLQRKRNILFKITFLTLQRSQKRIIFKKLKMKSMKSSLETEFLEKHSKKAILLLQLT